MGARRACGSSTCCLTTTRRFNESKKKTPRTDSDLASPDNDLGSLLPAAAAPLVAAGASTPLAVSQYDARSCKWVTPPSPGEWVAAVSACADEGLGRRRPPPPRLC